MSPKTTILLTLALMFPSSPVLAQHDGVRVTRLEGNPIVHPGLDPTIGTNINGPAMIRVPDWVERPLGRYYLYFAHHKGRYIRLAYADRVEGPWTIHPPGALALEDSHFPTEPPALESLPPTRQERIAAAIAAGVDPENALPYAHIASPEAVVAEESRQIRLYYHGLLANGAQATRVAVSRDGVHFEARPEPIGRPYFRAFRWRDQTYGLAMPGVFYRSADGLSEFEQGPTLFNPDMRHSALLLRGETLYVFWTEVGNTPERILLSTIALTSDWNDWRASQPVDVLSPEEDWEGARLPLAPSRRGAALEPVRELRDPAILEDDGHVWLLYSVAGERGIAIARLEVDP